jgi:integrase
MRPRNRLNRNLPPNLYISKKGKKYYFSYRHPVTCKHTGMGSDRPAAITAANELNGRLQPAATDLVARVIGGNHLMSTWLERYLDLYQDRKLTGGKPLSAETIRARKGHVKKISQHLGDRDITKIITKDIADYLDTLSHMPPMARTIRSALNDIFRVAITQGLISDNPVLPTRLPGVEVARSRLSLDEFTTILEHTGSAPWVRHSMYLAVLTGQRITDIANMQFRDISDNYLHIDQHKSGSLVRLSLDLRLDCLNMSIGDVVSMCRNNVVSPYLVHHVKNRSRAKKGGSVTVRAISKGFADARDKSGLAWDGPPSFHEMRSLSGRLYKAQKGVNVQNLLGHKDAKTTALYTDDRGRKWVSVG